MLRRGGWRKGLSRVLKSRVSSEALENGGGSLLPGEARGGEPQARGWLRPSVLCEEALFLFSFFKIILVCVCVF